MVVPVATELAAENTVAVEVLGLTTAANVVRGAGLSLLQFTDFVDPSVDCAALAHGRRLAANLSNGEVTLAESVAYLGLSYRDLEERVGAEQAAALYATLGRHAFLPVSILDRVLTKVKPDLVVITNSPRSERAVAICAKNHKIPVVCIVDLFAADEVKWLASDNYADAFCVLNEFIKEFLVTSGCDPGKVHVTGNPAFDRLRDPDTIAAGSELRRTLAWGDKHVLLWPCVDEPAVHPFENFVGDPSAPSRALLKLVEFCLSRNDIILCVRPRPGQQAPCLPIDPRIVITGADWNLAVLLHAVNIVVAMSTTVAIEAHLVGTRVIKILGSVFDKSMPLVEQGIAECEIPICEIHHALTVRVGLPNIMPPLFLPATSKVLEVIKKFL